MEDLHQRLSQELRMFFDVEGQLEEREMKAEMEETVKALAGGRSITTDDLEEEKLNAEIRLLKHREVELKDKGEKQIEAEVDLIKEMYGLSIDAVEGRNEKVEQHCE